MGWPAARRGPPGQGSVVSQRGKLARRHARSRDRSPERAVRHSRGAPAHRGGFTRQEEPLMVRKLNNFDEWIDYFRYWQDSIGLPQGEIRKFKFEAKFGEQEVPHIEFGHYKGQRDRKSTRLNSSHSQISYAVFCLKKKNKQHQNPPDLLLN